ncbi:GNAT family N-acetyltransferase [Plantactinospora sp. B24E8]|uniref:GNAT family N-acetyltransferase n=1 Tax=Plantactinospora sp. B24E8 TaxID=3153567 RepID=UPI00325CBAE3
MNGRQRAQVDVHLILRRDNRILLGERANTGWADGCWHLPSGHGEAGESPTTTLVREAAEEIGIRVKPSEARFVHLLHHRTDSPRMALFFEVVRWENEPVNREPDKCTGWFWFPVDDLPTPMVPYGRQALDHYLAGEPYAEHGWPDTERRLNPVAPAEVDGQHEHMAPITVRPLAPADVDVLPPAFAEVNWPGKTADQYRRYLAEQEAGTRSVLVASVDDTFAGYLTVAWQSGYRPFRLAGIPEIQDLNVLPRFRRRRVAWTLMDRAEELIAERSTTAGIGVGLYVNYSAAHLMYLRRGYLPDGRGVTYRGSVVLPGTSVRVDDDLVLMLVRRLG